MNTSFIRNMIFFLAVLVILINFTAKPVPKDYSEQESGSDYIIHTHIMCILLSFIMHPVTAGLILLISSSGIYSLAMFTAVAMRNTKNEIWLWIYKIIKFILDCIYYMIPSFSPFQEELSSLAQNFKVESSAPVYVLYAVGYSLSIVVLCYFISLYIIKKKKSLFV
ncbi:MAG: hypothetical protein A2Y62_20865 [Candidatus Fischerbacteria bacterium RBG_13_37_8]|uniref:Uncharacterized protein n=1 Tax=Candidatus Fischerbacteria bacterium RBG_13_37_8 TaxID=1817863 RepID=A0A1F5VEX7_9BACT|nr:MAG: hypothetical protein A2Y62_20865 [Candidatus Fischerbacteria bacterium RBG_13_37_8]